LVVVPELVFELDTFELLDCDTDDVELLDDVVVVESDEDGVDDLVIFDEAVKLLLAVFVLVDVMLIVDV